jgi:hypothetical protein
MYRRNSQEFPKGFWNSGRYSHKMAVEAAVRIGQRIPADPADVFFEKLDTIRATADKYAAASGCRDESRELS